MSKENPLDFGNNFLDHILVAAITDTDFLKKIRNTVDLKVFKSKERKELIQLCFNYFDEFKEAPQNNFYNIFEERKDFVSESHYERCERLIGIVHDIGNTNVNYILSKIRQAIAHYAMEEGIIKAAQLVKAKKYHEAKEIILNSFKEPEQLERSFYNFLPDTSFVERRSQGKVYKMKTLIDALDKVIGGLNPGWLVTFLGATKSGKSKMLMELAIAAAQQGLKVLFVSLEMNAAEVEDGLDQAIGFLGSEPGKPIEIMEQKKSGWVKVKKVVDTIFDLGIVESNRKALMRQGGRIYISDKSGGKFNYRDLNLLLDQIEQQDGIIFDVVIVDYLGETGPTEKGQKKKETIAANTSGFKGIAKERNLIVISAQQGNRSAMSAKVFNPNQISDAIEPVFISDLVIPICQTPKEEKMNIYRLYIALYRHGRKGDIVHLVRNLDIGQIALGSPSESMIAAAQEIEDGEGGDSDDY